MTHLTVSATSPRVQHVTASGVLTYSFPFAVMDAEDIGVYLGADPVPAGEYTVSGLRQSAGGAVTLSGPAEPGKTLTIVRIRPIKRMTDFLDGGEFRADTVNDALDSLTMIAQQLKEAGDRAIRVGVVSPIAPPFNAELPPPEPRRAVMIDGDGMGITYSTYDPDSTVDVALDARGAAQEAVDAANTALAAARAAGAGSQRAWGPFELIAGVQVYGPLPVAPPFPDDIEMFVDGLGQPLHPIGGPQAWSITNEHGQGLSLTLTAPVRENPGPGELQAGLPIYGTVLGGIIEVAIGNKTVHIRHLGDDVLDEIHAETGVRTVKFFGAQGDGSTDDTAAVQRAANWCAANGRDLVIPGGVYVLSSRIVAENLRSISGHGIDVSVLLWTNPSDAGLSLQFTIPYRNHLTISGLSLRVAGKGGTALLMDWSALTLTDPGVGPRFLVQDVVAEGNGLPFELGWEFGFLATAGAWGIFRGCWFIGYYSKNGSTREPSGVGFWFRGTGPQYHNGHPVECHIETSKVIAATYGMLWEGCEGAYARDCMCYEVDTGYQFRGGDSIRPQFNVFGCHVNMHFAGIVCDNAVDANFSDNLIYRLPTSTVASGGIMVVSDSATGGAPLPGNGFFIAKGNLFCDLAAPNRLVCVFVANAAYGVITSNSFRSGDIGIRLSPTSSHIKVAADNIYAPSIAHPIVNEGTENVLL